MNVDAAFFCLGEFGFFVVAMVMLMRARLGLSLLTWHSLLGHHWHLLRGHHGHLLLLGHHWHLLLLLGHHRHLLLLSHHWRTVASRQALERNGCWEYGGSKRSIRAIRHGRGHAGRHDWHWRSRQARWVSHWCRIDSLSVREGVYGDSG